MWLSAEFNDCHHRLPFEVGNERIESSSCRCDDFHGHGLFSDANDMETIGLRNIRTFVSRLERPDLSHFLINFYDAQQQPDKVQDTRNKAGKCNLTVPHTKQSKNEIQYAIQCQKEIVKYLGGGGVKK